VRLYLHGVTIALGKFDGMRWDGPGKVEPAQMQRLVLALGAANPYAAVAAVLGEPANRALARPEVLGKATLWTADGTGPATVLSAERDTFTPTFSGPPSWSGVPLDGTARLNVELADSDMMFNDPIGTFQINRDDMLHALQEGRVVQVRVDGQTSNQVLFAAISVMPE
jgi:hypothetical protein